MPTAIRKTGIIIVNIDSGVPVNDIKPKVQIREITTHKTGSKRQVRFLNSRKRIIVTRIRVKGVSR